MKRRSNRTSFVAVLVILLAPTAAAAAAAAPRLESALGREVSLSGERRPGTYDYAVVTTLSPMREDGSRAPAETLRAELRAVRTTGPGGPVTRYTCRSFSYARGGAAAVEIPALRDWSYTYAGGDSSAGRDAPMFGIDHAVFRNLKDATGAAFAPGESYMVYNLFVDFHAFCDVFAAPSPAGNGVQHLRRLGDRVRHAAAGSRPTVHLVGNVLEGSYFQNGEVVLELKGLAFTGGAPCALLGYDSGESRFEMALEPMPGVRATTAGGSRYTGDIEVDLETLWTRRVHMNEFIVSTTTVTLPNGGEPQKIRAIYDRQCAIRMVEGTEGRPR